MWNEKHLKQFIKQKILIEMVIGQVKKKWARRKLEWYVMPCGGGTLEAEVRYKGTTLIKRQRVKGYGVLRLDKPIPGAKYILRLIVSDPEQIGIIKSVEVTTHVLSLPSLITP
jgi:hypothetical protein